MSRSRRPRHGSSGRRHCGVGCSAAPLVRHKLDKAPSVEPEFDSGWDPDDYSDEFDEDLWEMLLNLRYEPLRAPLVR